MVLISHSLVLMHGRVRSFFLVDLSHYLTLVVIGSQDEQFINDSFAAIKQAGYPVVRWVLIDSDFNIH